jgi:hypothetical protein
MVFFSCDNITFYIAVWLLFLIFCGMNVCHFLYLKLIFIFIYDYFVMSYSKISPIAKDTVATPIEIINFTFITYFEIV